MATRETSTDRAPDTRPSRVVIRAVLPAVEGGRFAVKRSVGELLAVTAHVFTDGHDALRVDLLHRRVGTRGWERTPMRALGNDEWAAELPCEAAGHEEYTVEAWIDRFGTWSADLRKRLNAAWDVTAELADGAALLRETALGATKGGARNDADAAQLLREAADALDDEQVPAAERGERALADAPLASACATLSDAGSRVRHEPVVPLWVERERARFGAWYEMFPRSQGTDPARSATLREAAARLPAIAAMGFDVLYLPPVHPIGETKRKGPNNSLVAGPGDPGSPWAIGSAEGGHTALHPDLGKMEDWDWFVAEAGRHGLEIALDIALQCSPDHPWVRDHPAWFRHRPDGSIRYAENPPKRYEDIYPIDFDTEDWQALWQELLGVFLFWAEHGVRVFRVDNPHTKPFPFWEWLITEVHAEFPDAIFLAEAFTRPKRMEELARLGFSQSYSYFTWRNAKTELIEYFTELTRPPVVDFLRPNLFANTPDILHEYLQTGGRPAFLVRLVLAATLGPAYGIYSGFELCENAAVPGTEEYLDSEKYQVRLRDWDAPGNIVGEVSHLNRLRRALPAMQHSHELWFLPIENEQLLAYVKGDPALATGERVPLPELPLSGAGAPAEGIASPVPLAATSPTGATFSGRVVVIVNLDPRSPQEGWVGLPLAALGLAPDEPFVARDLYSGERYLWRGEWNQVRLDPVVQPAHILVIEGPAGSEQRREEFA